MPIKCRVCTADLALGAGSTGQWKDVCAGSRGHLGAATNLRQWQAVGDGAPLGQPAGASAASQWECGFLILSPCLMLTLTVSADSLIKLLHTDISGSPEEASFCEKSLKLQEKHK